MATQLSKADRIRKMLHLSNKDIAEIIGCREEYVRAVRQRTSPNGNPINGAANEKWAAANRDRLLAACSKRFKARYHNDPEYRAKHLARNAAYNKERYHADPEFRERILAYGRKRRAEARAS